jgi:hypothetical protein
MARVLSLAPNGWMLRTIADVAFMLSDGGRHPIFEKDVIALCELAKPHQVRIALHWSTQSGDLNRHPTIEGAYVVGSHMLDMARTGGSFPDAA